MRSAGYIFGVAVALAVLIGSITASAYAVWWAATWLLPEIARLYRESGTEFKLGLITAVLSTAGVVWSVMYQRRKELDALRFERKREAYNGFFEMLFEFMKAADTDTDLTSDPSFKDKWRKITKEMMIWASPASINAFNKFQTDSVNATASEDIKTVHPYGKTYTTVPRRFRASGFATETLRAQQTYPARRRALKA